MNLYFFKVNTVAISMPTTNRTDDVYTFTQHLISNTVSGTVYATIQDIYRGIRPPCWASGRHKCSECKHTQYKRPQEKTVTIRDVSVAIIPSCQQNARTSANCWSESSERDKDVKKPRIIISLKRFREKPLPLSLISHCVLTLKGGPDRLIYNPARADKTMLISHLQLNVTQLLSGGILEKEVGGARVWMLSEGAAGIIYRQLPYILPLPPPQRNPFPPSPDRSINHSVTEIVTQSACKMVWRKCERGEGFLRHCR